MLSSFKLKLKEKSLKGETAIDVVPKEISSYEEIRILIRYHSKVDRVKFLFTLFFVLTVLYRIKLRHLFRIQRLLSRHCSGNVTKRVLLNLICIQILQEHTSHDDALSTQKMKHHSQIIFQHASDKETLKKVNIADKRKHPDLLSFLLDSWSDPNFSPIFSFSFCFFPNL